VRKRTNDKHCVKSTVIIPSNEEAGGATVSASKTCFKIIDVSQRNAGAAEMTEGLQQSYTNTDIAPSNTGVAEEERTSRTTMDVATDADKDKTERTVEDHAYKYSENIGEIKLVCQ
jgi:hypothetical protein